MKKYFVIALVLAALAACGPRHTISGNISGVESGKLLLACNNDADEMVMDSVILDNGNFFYDPASKKPQILMIVDEPVKEPAPEPKKEHTPRYVPEGMVLPEDDEDADFDMAAYSARERELSAEWNSIALDFIRKNPTSDVCAYLAREISSAEMFLEADELISDKVKKGPLGDLIEARYLLIDAEAQRQSARGTIFEGAEAPDFTLKTSTGETFTLSEHRGSYVMLDFWGTWCGWCVEGLPNVKEIAHRYADRLTVVSVDCGDSEEAWLNGIRKYEMDWVQVYNGKADAIDSKYAVEGYPGFYLIDPQGVIRMMAFGEPAHFVEKIGELISE